MSINLHAGQSEVYSSLFLEPEPRFVVVNCSRGWGKTYLAGTAAITAVFELMEMPQNVPNKTVHIIAPTYDQVTDIYYPLLNYDLSMDDVALKSSKDLGRFIFPNNVELRLMSYEAVERMRGKGSYLTVWDEVSSCKKGLDPKEAWQSVIQPCIATRWSAKRAQHYGARSPGRALMISTPKGFNFFHELFHYSETDPQWRSFHYDYTGSPFLDEKEIENLRRTLDPIQFATEYLASFKESGSSVFYCFDRKTHVAKDLLPFQEGETVYACIDFNVGLQCTSTFALRGGQIHILEEFKGHPDTETLAQVLKERYKGHKIVAFPDPSGRARKTSAPVGRTDFSILASAGIECLAHQKAPPVTDSVAAVNRKLKTASGAVGLYVSANCTGVITSLERTRWVDNKPDVAIIDKSDSVEHFSDGLRYGIEYLFPITANTRKTSRGFGF